MVVTVVVDVRFVIGKGGPMLVLQSETHEGPAVTIGNVKVSESGMDTVPTRQQRCQDCAAHLAD